MYCYGGNNPVRYVDPDGRIVSEAISIILGIRSLSSNIKNGNVLEAAIDTCGIIADAAALALPLIPGGASAAIKAVRTVGTVATKAENALSVVDGVMDGDFLEVVGSAANLHGGKAVNAEKSLGSVSQVQQNRAKGIAFEKEMNPKISAAGYKSKTQVSARAANGKIIRIDNLATRDGKLKIFEMKSSSSAGYTKNQELAGYPIDFLSQDYTIVGKKGGTMYPAGTVIPKGTIIQTLRPGSIVE